MTDIPSLIERATDTASRYMNGVGGANDCARVLAECAEALSRLSASPLPEEIAGLIEKLRNYHGRTGAYAPDATCKHGVHPYECREGCAPVTFEGVAALERLSGREFEDRNGELIVTSIAALREILHLRERVAELETAAKAPLPEKIAGLVERLLSIADGADIRDDQQGELRKAAAALQQQARENQWLKDADRVHAGVGKVREQRLHELEAEIERLNIILGNHGVTQLEKTEIMLAQKERIRELEAERDCAESASLRVTTALAKAISDRDAIRAKTIAEIVARIQATADSIPGVTADGKLMKDTCLDIMDAIRALSQPPEAGEGGE